MRYCYISRNYHNPKSAGGKAKSDIEDILQKMGAHNLGWKRTCYKNKILEFILNLSGVIKAALSMRKGDVVVLQYPVKKYLKFLCWATHFSGGKVVAVIHDLGAFRSKRITSQEEANRLQGADVIICHNEKMKQILLDMGITRPLVCLGIFDYLGGICQDKDMAQESGEHSVYFMGQLASSSNQFIYNLSALLKTTTFHLFGNKFEQELLPTDCTTSYHGFAVDMDIIQNPPAEFGLSWYGESLTFGKGKIGEYMSINNPHKVSLYLRCGTPVILWKHAGLAEFVDREQCGLLVDSLENLDDQLNTLTKEQISSMCANARRVGSLIAKGHYFETAFRKAISLL